MCHFGDCESLGVLVFVIRYVGGFLCWKLREAHMLGLVIQGAARSLCRSVPRRREEKSCGVRIELILSSEV